jgi:nucleoside-diphosphate-sugar epimerase
VRIFVAGATGVLGRPTVAALIQAGHKVYGAARGPEKAALLHDAGARPVSVNLFNAASVQQALIGCDAVINLATKIPPISKMRNESAWEENDLLRRHASRIIADAARLKGARLYVQESITFMYDDGGEEWLTEESPLDASWIALQSMLEAEKATRAFAAAGGRGVSVRFGAFYAPYAQSTIDTARLAGRGLFPVAGKGESYFSSVHVDDAAAAVVAALDLPSGVFNVVDDEPLTQLEYAVAVTKAVNASGPRKVPRWLFKLVLGGPASYLLRSQRVANLRFKEATGWSPRYPTAREGWRHVAAAWEEESRR